MPRSTYSRPQPEGYRPPFGGSQARFVPQAPFGGQDRTLRGAPADEGGYMPKQNSGVMFHGMDMTAPAAQERSFVDIAQQGIPPRTAEPQDVLSGLRKDVQKKNVGSIAGIK